MIAREVRMGGLDASAAARADARFETGLRAGDALHLGIASTQSAEAIYSLDQTLVRAGAILSLPVRTGM